MSISTLLTGNLADLNRYSGARTTSCASPGSILTKALMTASSLNSCACTICACATAQASRHHVANRNPRRLISCLAIDSFDKARPRHRRRRRMTRVAELTSRRRLSPSSGSRSAAIAFAVALAVAVVALGVRELLHAASVDRFAGVDVALRVDRVAV